MNQLLPGPLKPPDSLPQHSRATRTQGSHPPLAALLEMSPRTATPPATQLCQLTASHPAHNHHSSRHPLWPPTSSRGDKGTDGLSTAVKGGNGLLWHKWLSQLRSKHRSSHLVAQLSLLAWAGSSSGEVVALLDLLHSDSYQDRLGGLCNEKGTQHLKGYFSLESRGWEWKQEAQFPDADETQICLCMGARKGIKVIQSRKEII